MYTACLVLVMMLSLPLYADRARFVISSGQRDISSMSELDPHELVSENLTDVVRNLYDTLYDMQSNGTVTEGLAEKCSIESFTEDVEYNLSMNILCKIRKRIYFHDGLPLRTHDVVFSILRAKNSRTVSSNFNFIKDVQEVSPNTIRFILSYNTEGISNTKEWLFERFKKVLARFGYVVRADYFTGGSGWALEYPVGTGPFYFKDWKLWDAKESRSQIILLKNRSYWKKDVVVPDEIVFRFLPSSMWTSCLKDGSVSLLYRLPYDEYEKLSKVNRNKGYFKLLKRLEYSYQYFLFTPNSFITQSLDLKRAFFSGINREKIAKNVFGKNVLVNSGRALYSSTVYPEKFPVLPYRPDLSRELVRSYLRMKGLHTNKLPISILVSDRAEDLEVVKELEKQLSIAGFEPTIKVVQLRSYRMLINKSDLEQYDVVLYSVNEQPNGLTPKARAFLKNGGIQMYQRYMFYAMSRPNKDGTLYAKAVSKFSPPAEGPLNLLNIE